MMLTLKIIGGVVLLIIAAVVVLALTIFSDPDTYR